MKTKNLWRTWLIGLVSMFAVAVAFSCSDKDDSEIVPEPTETEGEVTFTISNETGGSGSGDGTSSSPAVVEQGETLDMAISQKSSYTDPNGSVFTCEPKATIKLFAKDEVIRAKDFQTLIEVKELSNESSTSSLATNLRSVNTLQKFSVGGQEITFDLAHEIYNFVNSQNANIEMPYVKLNSAQYGTAQSEEKETEARAIKARVGSVRFAPLKDPRRVGTITDETAYEVTVSFTLEIESVHTASTQAQTLSFEVKYVGIVETTTEYPDSKMEYAQSLESVSGSMSTASPFVLTSGETLSLEWKQQSTFTYFSVADRTLKTLAASPKATVSVAVATDTIWVETTDGLDKVVAAEPSVSVSETNPEVHSGSQNFEIAGQVVTLNWAYDAYAAQEVEEYTAEWPYLKLGIPEVTDITVAERPDVTIPNKEAKVYEVTLRLKQSLEGVNTNVTETLEYVVKYIAVMEVTLVEVGYRKGYEWLAPHDNIPLASRYILYRDRTYSTGETFTDTYYSMNTAVEYNGKIVPCGGGLSYCRSGSYAQWRYCLFPWWGI